MVPVLVRVPLSGVRLLSRLCVPTTNSSVRVVHLYSAVALVVHLVNTSVRCTRAYPVRLYGLVSPAYRVPCTLLYAYAYRVSSGNGKHGRIRRILWYVVLSYCFATRRVYNSFTRSGRQTLQRFICCTAGKFKLLTSGQHCGSSAALRRAGTGSSSTAQYCSFAPLRKVDDRGN